MDRKIKHFAEQAGWMMGDEPEGFNTRIERFANLIIEESMDEIKRLQSVNSEYREALEYIADMPDGWEEDEELNLLFVVDNHVNVARDVLLGPLANDKDCA